MEYNVVFHTIETGFFGGITKDKLCKKLAEKLNSLASEGWEIVSVMTMNSKGDAFDYQIVCRK